MGQIAKKMMQLRRRLEKERPRLFPECGMIISLLNHPQTPLTLILSPSDVPKPVQDKVDFLLSLSQEPEYVNLVKQVAIVPVCHVSGSFCDAT